MVPEVGLGQPAAAGVLLLEAAEATSTSSTAAAALRRHLGNPGGLFRLSPEGVHAAGLLEAAASPGASLGTMGLLESPVGLLEGPPTSSFAGLVQRGELLPFRSSFGGSTPRHEGRLGRGPTERGSASESPPSGEGADEKGPNASASPKRGPPSSGSSMDTLKRKVGRLGHEIGMDEDFHFMSIAPSSPRGWLQRVTAELREVGESLGI